MKFRDASFRIGEFAKLCGVTKDTLFYYEKLGLLKPDRIDINGYRYYAPNQFFYMEMIKALKESGAPLNDICEYKDNYNISQYLKIVKMQRDYLNAEIERLQGLYTTLNDSIQLTSTALNEPRDMPRIVHCEEKHLVAWDIPANIDASADPVAVEATTIATLLKYCQKSGIKPLQPVGSIVSKEFLLSGQVTAYKCCFCVNEACDDDHIIVRPKGTYLTLLHKDLYTGQGAAYEILFDYIRKHNLRICGDCYESELIGYLGEGKPENFIVQYEIQIEDDRS